MSEAKGSKKGFASMDPEHAREIQAMGGRTAHKNGNANTFTSETAKKAAAISWERRRAKMGIPIEPQ
jgi:uncharacterized protein